MVGALLILAALAAPAAAQQGGPVAVGDVVPFERWIAEPERTELPWVLRISRPTLSLMQRPLVQIQARLPRKTLDEPTPEHELYLVARLMDGTGRWQASTGALATRTQERLPRGTHLRLNLHFLALPGDYTLGLVLYDRATGRRNIHRRAVRIPPMKNDPLPHAFRGLPRVEFLEPVEGPRPAQGPESRARLWLPARHEQPLEVEILANVTPAEQLAGSRRAHDSNLLAVLTTVQLLTQMAFSDAIVRFTALDLVRRRVVFAQENAQPLDWPRLREAVAAVDPATISAGALAGRRQNPAFFREEVARRLERPGPNGNGSPGPRSQPLRVLFIVSSYSLFEPGADTRPLGLAEACHCRVYYLQLAGSAGAQAFVNPSRRGRVSLAGGSPFDDLPRVLRPLKPRRFELHTPEDLRKALAAILADLRRH
jgi:hypothetical protein